MHVINPGGSPEIAVFTEDGSAGTVCGLSLRRGGAPSVVAKIGMDCRFHTQRVMFGVFQSGRLYEAVTSLLSLGALRPGDVALDVGAHVGYFTTLFRLAVGDQGRVFAFEPMPKTYGQLLKNVMANGFFNVLPLPFAVGDRPGIASFHVDPDNEGASSLLPSSAGEQLQVQVACIDDLLTDTLTSAPRLVKMDVEGVECLALRGARRLFERFPPDVVICEINRGALQIADTGEAELRQFFTDRGYRGALINNGLMSSAMQGAMFYRYVTPGESLPESFAYVFNMMFVREGSGLYPDPAM